MTSTFNKNEGRTIVITGASAGVGRATAREFAKVEKNPKIILLARGKDRLKKAQQEIATLGWEALYYSVDVADFESLEIVAQEIVDRFGKIDVWVNNAMTSVFSPFKEMSCEEFKRVIDVNLMGYVYGTKIALKHMLPQNKGHIIQVGSALAYRAIPLQSAYCASKFGIRGFSDSLRSELIHDQSEVRLTAVHLPAINTPQFDWTKNRLKNQSQPVPPIFQPEMAAQAIVWASVNNRRDIWLGYPTWKTILGSALTPAKWVDRYLSSKAYEGQQTDQPRIRSEDENNLMQALPGDYGAHGSFDEKAKNSPLQLWMSLYPGRTLLAGLSLALTASFFPLARKLKWNKSC